MADSWEHLYYRVMTDSWEHLYYRVMSDSKKHLYNRVMADSWEHLYYRVMADSWEHFYKSVSCKTSFDFYVFYTTCTNNLKVSLYGHIYLMIISECTDTIYSPESSDTESILLVPSVLTEIKC